MELQVEQQLALVSKGEHDVTKEAQIVMDRV